MLNFYLVIKVLLKSRVRQKIWKTDKNVNMMRLISDIIRYRNTTVKFILLVKLGTSTGQANLHYD